VFCGDRIALNFDVLKPELLLHVEQKV